MIKSATAGQQSFPSLNLAVNFNDIAIVDNSKFTFTWKNCQLNACTSVTSGNISYSGSLRPLDLKKFIRLNIPTISNVPISADLKSIYNIVCSDTNAQYCSTASKILACNNDYFWNVDASDNQSCAQTCSSSFPTYLYQATNSLASLTTQNTNTGYCTSSCSASNGAITCPTGNLTSNSYGSSLACNSSSSYTKFSIFCIPNTTTNPITSLSPNSGSLLYSQGFNSPTIEINLSSTLTEYHIEVWFMPDLVFLPKNNATGKYYVFWTNSIRIKKDSKLFSGAVVTNDYKVYNGSTATAIIPTNSKLIEMKNGQWTKISYSVVKNGSNWDVNYYYKNDSDAGYKQTGISSNPSLTKIAFCTNNCGSYYSDGGWYSGAYKLLRVWDSTFFPLDTYRQTER